MLVTKKFVSSVFLFLDLLFANSCRSLAHKAEVESRLTTAAEASQEKAFTVLGPNQKSIARILTKADVCPQLIVDGVSTPMTKRGTPSSKFDITTCDLTLSPSARSVMLGAQALPLPKADPQRIIVLGDTGCEIKTEKSKTYVQNCLDGVDWPLAQVAITIAGLNPDLIIHVGDYHYREVPCPEHDADKCAGASTGDIWPSWNEDWFGPAAPLFAVAPFVFIRGNHETCDRAGSGWFQFLDPRPLPSVCTDSTDPYWVDAGDHHLAVIDSADDKNMQPSFDGLKPLGDGFTWWVLHRPFLSPDADDEKTAKDPPYLPPAWSAPGALGAIITGHKHLLKLSSFPLNNTPPELISGNGSTRLEKPDDKNTKFYSIRTKAMVGLEYYDYGFLAFDRVATGVWKVKAYSRAAEVIATCDLNEKTGAQSVFNCSAKIGGPVEVK